MVGKQLIRLATASLALAGVAFGGGSPLLAQPKPPLVLAAASLQDVLMAESTAWMRLGHAKPVLSFASSSALARQIESGAPADIFISADEDWMNDVAAKGGLRPNSRFDIASNTLVLIAPVNSQIQLRIRPGFAVAAALGGGRLAMADPDSVPAGKYGKLALTALRVWPSVATKVARAENVRAALELVVRGEAPLGIVYATDAQATPRVRIVGVFPAASHPAIRYPAAALKTSMSTETDGFLSFLRSEPGRAIFKQFGFGPA